MPAGSDTMSRPGRTVVKVYKNVICSRRISVFCVRFVRVAVLQGHRRERSGWSYSLFFGFNRDKLREDCMLNRHWARMFLIVIVAASGIALRGQANSSLRG